MNVLMWTILGLWLGGVSIMTWLNWRRQLQNDEAIVRLSLQMLDHKIQDHKEV